MTMEKSPDDYGKINTVRNVAGDAIIVGIVEYKKGDMVEPGTHM